MQRVAGAVAGEGAPASRARRRTARPAGSDARHLGRRLNREVGRGANARNVPSDVVFSSRLLRGRHVVAIGCAVITTPAGSPDLCDSVRGRPVGHPSGMKMRSGQPSPLPWPMARHAEGLSSAYRPAQECDRSSTSSHGPRLAAAPVQSRPPSRRLVDRCPTSCEVRGRRRRSAATFRWPSSRGPNRVRALFRRRARAPPWARRTSEPDNNSDRAREAVVHLI